MAKAFKYVAAAIVTGVGLFFHNPTLIQAGLRMFGMAVLATISEALQPGKPRATRNAQEIEYFGTTEPRRIIYGTNKVSGMNCIPPITSGTNNVNLHQVLALAGHQVSAIGDVYFNQDVIDSDASPYVITPVTGTANDGLVVSGTYANKAWIRRYTGAPSGSPGAWTSDYILTTAWDKWTSAHKGSGVAYLALTYVYDEEAYKTGKPEVSCIVNGALCYDPRLDVTPGASPTNDSYIAFTSNPALCLAHYLTNSTVGMGESASRIDWDLVVAAANTCDEQVAIPPAASPINYQNRYTCNVVLDVAATDDERRENIKILAGAMMGHCYYRSSKWRIYAGEAASASFALTDDDVVGKMSFRTELPSSEKYNYVRGQFVDPDRNWQLSEFEPRSSSAYETTDGDRKQREVSFPACTNKYEAQRNALIVLKRSRLKKQVQLELGMSAYRIMPWDVGTLTLAEMGWTAQSVRCLGWSLNPEGTISATFLEEDSTDWDDPAVGDYTVPAAAGNSAVPDYTPDAPTSITTVGLYNAIFVEWTPAANNPPGTRFNLYEFTATSPTSGATKIRSALSGNSVTLARAPGTTYYYWVSAVRYGVESSLVPAGDGVSGAAVEPPTGAAMSASASPSYLYKATLGTSATTASTTCTPVDGSPTYTYSWARISGDSGTNVTSSTFATTTFSRSGMSVGTYSSVWRCTVTDSASPQVTATADVSVELVKLS